MIMTNNVTHTHNNVMFRRAHAQESSL